MEHLQWIVVAGTSGYELPHILDWINAASKGIRLWFGMFFMYKFCGGSIENVKTSVQHVSEGFLVAGMGCIIVWMERVGCNLLFFLYFVLVNQLLDTVMQKFV